MLDEDGSKYLIGFGGGDDNMGITTTTVVRNSA